MKQIIVPGLLFIVSSILSITFLELAFASFLLGGLIFITAAIRKRRETQAQNMGIGDKVLLRSGLVLMLAPILTIAFVFAGMSGLFGK